MCDVSYEGTFNYITGVVEGSTTPPDLQVNLTPKSVKSMKSPTSTTSSPI